MSNFTERLDELIENAGLSLGNHAKLKEFLDDRAEAIRDLVVAAEEVCDLMRVDYMINKESPFVALDKALAALNSEEKP